MDLAVPPAGSGSLHVVGASLTWTQQHQRVEGGRSGRPGPASSCCPQLLHPQVTHGEGVSSGSWEEPPDRGGVAPQRIFQILW